jgi:protein involved in polysaccharide export with SLBB domain
MMMNRMMNRMQVRLRTMGHALLILPLLAVGGCNVTKFQPPTEDSMRAFNEAGAVLPQANPGDYATGAKATLGRYRLGPGDGLLVQVAPREGGGTLSTVGPDSLQAGMPAHVAADGTIKLQYATENVKVAGMTVAEAEDAITALYCPKYYKLPPLVYLKVMEKQTQTVAISGSVVKASRYELSSDRMTLLSLLSEAGGISAGGTPVVRIHRAATEKDGDKTILLNATHGTALGDDIALEAGDSVEVETIPSNSITVIGLVNAPGRFDYQNGSQINLIQALGYAGGINWIADPRFARIYRRDTNGNLVTADFKLSDGKTPLGAATVVLKPGDVVAVEQTKETAALLFAQKTIQASLGLNLGVIYTLGSDVRYRGN